VAALAADVGAHAWLRELVLVGPVAHVLDPIVTAALARRLTALHFLHGGLTPASVPLLARLLGGGACTALSVLAPGPGHAPLLDAPSAALLAGALRANSTLTALHLNHMAVWDSVATAAELLGALTAHPSLRTLRLRHDASLEDEVDHLATGAALGALLAADAPALTALSVSDCHLGDAGMAPLFAALHGNTHLHTLDCPGNDMSEAFARDVLLPAVRANASLRALDTGRRTASGREAEDIVNGRAAAP
jgi:hypothetical protein